MSLTHIPAAPRRAPASRISPVPAAPVSRRALFKSAAAVAAFWGTTEAALARRGGGEPPDVSADADPGSLTAKLVRRITLGLTTAELTSAASLGYSGYLENQLNYTAIDDSAADAAIAGLTTLSMQPYQLYPLTAAQIINELTEGTLRRSVLSRRQLYQRMVELWTDHFNIDITKEIDTHLKTVDDRDVIRANALGTFPALLSASAHSPAMLTYLDNQTSVAGNPNENYARELMELHTLSVSGGYTQTDVSEVARCLTGWTITRQTNNPGSGVFRFDATVHDTGSKTVLGQVIPGQSGAAGINEGLTVLSILANHPSTAVFIATKICKWLVSETPSQALINSVAATYTSTGGDIKAMIRTALAPNVLYDAPPKYKRPYHLFVSALRALPATITTINSLRNQLASAGHQQFYWTTPDGYPDTLLYWSGLILPRWNFGALLATGGLSGVSVDTAAFFSGLTTAAQMANTIDQSLFGGEMPAADKSRIQSYLLPDPPTSTRRNEALGLAIGSPGFQWY
jgi:uncharacterized protein (DUF1800 family)